MRINGYSQESGFTLVEALMAVAIFVILAAGLQLTLLSGHRLWRTSENAVTLQKDVRNSIWMMTKDLRMARAPLITSGAGFTTISFSHPSDGNITYSWSSAGANAKKLIRQSSSGDRVLAQNISNLTFTDQGTSLLISVTVSKQAEGGNIASINLQEEVMYR